MMEDLPGCLAGRRPSAAWRQAPRFTALLPRRHGLGVTWACVEDHPPEPPGLDAVATLFGQHGEVAQGEMAEDALVDIARLIGTLQRSFAGAGLGTKAVSMLLCSGEAHHSGLSAWHRHAGSPVA